jgi:hypothetical protein
MSVFNDRECRLSVIAHSVIPPESLCNPQLDDTFRGIERFLETDLIENVLHGSVRPKSTHTKYPLNIDHKVLAAKKRDLLAAFDARPDPGLFMTGLVEWLNDEVLDAVGAAPTRQMLLPY